MQVRVQLNQADGVLWWAEGDEGFVGGADRLAELVGYIEEWAESEGFIDDLEVQLVSSVPESPPGPVLPHVDIPGGHSSPPTHGVQAVRAQRVLV